MGALVEGSSHRAAGVAAYWHFLAGNRPYRMLMLGEVINQAGSWGNYIASMNLVERLGGGSAVLVSCVVIVRVLPALFLFPAAGVVADRFNRVAVLVVTCLLSAVTVAALPLVQTPGTLWLLFALLTALFSAGAFTDPARRALTPQLVPPHELHLAATLDAFSWSLMAAVGASLGGLLVSRLGTSACFLIDAATYVVAAGCSALVLREPAAAAPAPTLQRHRASDSASTTWAEPDALKPASSDASKLFGDDDPEAAHGSQQPKPQLQAGQHKQPQPQLQSEPPASGDSELHLGSGQRHRQHQHPAAELNSLAGEHRSRSSSSTLSGTSSRTQQQEAAAASSQPSGAWRQAAADLREGWVYMTARGNRDVAALTLIKASGAFIWGAADVLYVRFADEPAMQVRDSATTMGLIFGGIGLGAFLGPLLFNPFTPSLKPYLLRSCGLAFTTLAAGYGLMTAAPSLPFLLPAVVIRSLGSAALWIYSTLILQFRVPNDIQGRVFSLEMAFFVSAETASGLLGGVMFDRLRLGTQQVSAIMGTIATAIAVVWCRYAWKHWQLAVAAASGKQGAAAGIDTAYELVPQHAGDDVLESEEGVCEEGLQFEATSGPWPAAENPKTAAAAEP